MIKSRQFLRYPAAAKETHLSHYKLKSLVLTLWLLCCAFIALSPSASHALSIDARALEQRLSAANLFGFTNTEVANLQRFYKARQHQPIWIAPESSRLEMALAFIAAADTEGLNSNDYQLHQLQQLQQQPDPSLQAATELEIRTTHAMLSLTRDLSRGRLTATKADADWHIPQTAFDAASFLQDAIKNDRLQPSLHNLAPQQSSYQVLKQTLARYQKLHDHHTELGAYS
jgi:murein L,D-transpeptidase YcbB/YkuD